MHMMMWHTRKKREHNIKTLGILVERIHNIKINSQIS